MTAILASLLPALFPAISDGVRGIFGMLTGNKGAQPQSVDQVIQLMNADIERLKVLSALDSPAGNVHAWVSDIRALQRPAAVALVLAAYLVTVTYTLNGHVVPASVLDGVAQYAQMVTFYLFGDRSYAYLKGGK